MNKLVLVLGLVFLGTSFNAYAQHNHNGEGIVEKSPQALEALKLKETDMFVGEKDAPVQVVEYASMTCGHCAHFHNTYFEEIKEKFVNTGKVRFVLRDLPWDNRALAVSTIARCAPKEQYFDYISAFMGSHDAWVQSDDFLASVKKIARLGGMTSEAVDTCLKNPEIIDIVKKNRSEAMNVLEITGTPTFFVNGMQVNGIMTTEELGEIVKNYEEQHSIKE